VGRLRGGVRRVVRRASNAAATLGLGMSLSIVVELGVTNTATEAAAVAAAAAAFVATSDDATTAYMGLAVVDTTKGCGGVEGRCADDKGVGTAAVESTSRGDGGRDGDDDVGTALMERTKGDDVGTALAERTKGGCLNDDDGMCDGTTTVVVVVSVKGVRSLSTGKNGSGTATAVTTGSCASSNARQENGRT
jgi:hypothetical protein